MTYQEIVTLVRNTANTVLGSSTGAFIHGTKRDSSEAYDQEGDLIVLLPFESNLTLTGGGPIFAIHNLLMAFWRQDSPETSPLEREAIISAMDLLCRRFLEQLDDDAQGALSAVVIQPDYRQLMSTKSGYLLRLSIDTASAICDENSTGDYSSDYSSDYSTV